MRRVKIEMNGDKAEKEEEEKGHPGAPAGLFQGQKKDP